MAHCQHFPFSAQTLGEGILRGCEYVNLTIVSKCRKAKFTANRRIVDLIYPGSKSIVFLEKEGVYVTDDTEYTEEEFPLPTVYEVTGTYDKGATFWFTVESDANTDPENTEVSLRGSESYITIEQPVFDEERRFVKGVSHKLLQAIVDTCGGHEY